MLVSYGIARVYVRPRHEYTSYSRIGILHCIFLFVRGVLPKLCTCVLATCTLDIVLAVLHFHK